MFQYGRISRVTSGDVGDRFQLGDGGANRVVPNSSSVICDKGNAF